MESIQEKSTKTTHDDEIRYLFCVLWFRGSCAVSVTAIFFISNDVKQFDKVKRKTILNLLLLEAIDFTVNLLAGFELLLHSDQEGNTINDHLDQLDLGEAKTIGVGDVENLVDIVRLVLTPVSKCYLHHPRRRYRHHRFHASGV